VLDVRCFGCGFARASSGTRANRNPLSLLESFRMVVQRGAILPGPFHQNRMRQSGNSRVIPLDHAHQKIDRHGTDRRAVSGKSPQSEQ